MGSPTPPRARLDEIERRYDATALALGDFNSTGFRGDPAEERPFVSDHCPVVLQGRL